MKNRNCTLDIAKGIGIILVVVGHNWAVSHEKGEVFRIIFSFHMPLFFFLSGVFLNESNSLKEFSISRMHSLLKPYFATLVIIGFVKLASDIINNRDYSSNFFNYMMDVFYATGRTIAWPPLWYLPHLFIVSCIALLAIKFINSNRIKWLILVSSLGAGVFLLNPSDLPWSVDLLPISLSFFVSGYMCRNFIKSMAFNATYFLISLSLFSLFHYFFNDTIDLNLRLYDNLLVSTLQATLGIYIILSSASFLASYVVAAKMIGYIGSGTLFILLFHSFIQDKTFRLLMKPMGDSWLSGICSLIAGVFLPLILWEFAKRSNYLTAIFLPQPKSNLRMPDSNRTILATPLDSVSPP